MESDKKVLVIIPAYNEEVAVGNVVEEVKNCLTQVDILVVNDGSTDLTSERARVYGTTVLDLPFNLGIGGAMQAGYRYAHEKGYDIAIQVDADGQHDPKDFLSSNKFSSKFTFRIMPNKTKEVYLSFVIRR